MPPRRQWFKEVARAVRSSVVLLSRPLRLVDAVLCCILDVAGLGRQPRLGVVQLVAAVAALSAVIMAPCFCCCCASPCMPPPRWRSP
uniref:Uncharacterized protein n=1 Tax=Zea mays TaxID=4577 RepID=A0A804MCD0_MAIZE